MSGSTRVSILTRACARLVFVAALALQLAACASQATLTVSAGSGPAPVLPAPTHTLIPTVRIARAVGWPDGATPQAAAGLQVTPFARNLDHPRWLYVLPNGDVLVAETNAPPKPDDGKGVRGWIMGKLMVKAGARVPSANRITLLRSAGTDAATMRSVLIDGLNSPFGMALVGDTLYVADSDAVLRFPYVAGATRIDTPGVKVVDLPAGRINHHWTKNLVATANGSKLYVTIGSNSNVAENGIEAEANRAAIWEVDPRTGQHRIFASGLRNPNGLAWEPATQTLWTVVNERDEIGGDLVPDYLTSVRDGAFYGWPWSYYGSHVDERVVPPRPDMVAKAVVPDYALGPHTASLGLAWSSGTLLPPAFSHGMFVGQHGSWNRKPLSGYRVVFVPFVDDRPASAPPIDVLTGFVSADEDIAFGRPVGVAIAKDGALLVADDVGNTVWRVATR